MFRCEGSRLSSFYYYCFPDKNSEKIKSTNITTQKEQIKDKILTRKLENKNLKRSVAEHNSFFKDNINWTRGRFQGRAVSIVLKNGIIVEKIFLTKKGTLISVKRKELGLIHQVIDFALKIKYKKLKLLSNK